MKLRPTPSAHLVPLLVLAAAVGALLTGTASAGPNAGGTLILHVPVYVIDTDYGSWCPVVEEELPLDECRNAIVNVEDPATHLWVVYAAFDPVSSPRLAGLTFGVDYDESNLIPVIYQACGDFELPMSNWPEPNTGTAITWNTAQTTHLVQVFVFAGYEYYGGSATFDLIPHPIGGGAFADDDVPANIDPIAAYGSIGFGGASGDAPCPGGTSGACCLPDGQCVEVSGTHCEDLGGAYVGDDSVCTPDTCEPVPVLESSWGTVKEIFR